MQFASKPNDNLRILNTSLFLLKLHIIIDNLGKIIQNYENNTRTSKLVILRLLLEIYDELIVIG